VNTKLRLLIGFKTACTAYSFSHIFSIFYKKAYYWSGQFIQRNFCFSDKLGGNFAHLMHLCRFCRIASNTCDWGVKFLKLIFLLKLIN